ncbi:MAG: hypothetical protein ABH803_00525, partial [Candidatus Micrarchaeota archaeon]
DKPVACIIPLFYNPSLIDLTGANKEVSKALAKTLVSGRSVGAYNAFLDLLNNPFLGRCDYLLEGVSYKYVVLPSENDCNNVCVWT